MDQSKRGDNAIAYYAKHTAQIEVRIVAQIEVRIVAQIEVRIVDGWMY